MATLQDVALTAGVSKTTVSRYLNKSIELPATTIARIDAAIAQHEYRPNLLARRFSTGKTEAIGLVIPELAGKLDGSSIRVPTPCVSLIDLTVDVGRATSKDEINDAFKQAAASGPLKGILAITNQPNVSSDFIHDAHSATFHLDQTKVIEGTFVRVVAWYDNEWGFSNRMADATIALAKTL